MNIEQMRDYCLSRKGATEDSAFGEDHLLFRIYDKIFACLSLNRPDCVTLKCDPERALELREHYAGIEGAFHWNKRYWNDVRFDADVPDELILELVDHSISEVLRKLPKRIQAEYAGK